MSRRVRRGRTDTLHLVRNAATARHTLNALRATGAAAATGAALVTAALMALAGCGGGNASSDPSGGNEGAGAVVNSELRLANCQNWNDSTVEQRLGTISDLGEFAGGPIGQVNGHGATLSDDKAYDLLDTACKPAYARGFELYKLYTRGAAFAGAEGP